MLQRLRPAIGQGGINLSGLRPAFFCLGLGPRRDKPIPKRLLLRLRVLLLGPKVRLQRHDLRLHRQHVLRGGALIDLLRLRGQR